MEEKIYKWLSDKIKEIQKRTDMHKRNGYDWRNPFDGLEGEIETVIEILEVIDYDDKEVINQLNKCIDDLENISRYD